MINLFNRQGNAIVNLGGLNAQGGPAMPVDVLSSSELTFTVPAAAADGPAYLQVINPPFIGYSSSGADPEVRSISRFRKRTAMSDIQDNLPNPSAAFRAEGTAEQGAQSPSPARERVGVRAINTPFNSPRMESLNVAPPSPVALSLAGEGGSALSLSLIALAAALPARAATVDLPPNSTITLGSSMLYTMTIDDATAIEGADFRITYDSAVVRPVGDALITNLSSSCTPVTNAAVLGTRCRSGSPARPWAG